MIYLKPRGGLCNRIRTIDSTVALCKEKNEDLVVFWVQDGSLNIEFEKLFSLPQFDAFNFKLINCPVGFPELYQKGSITKIKNLIKGRKLPRHLKIYLKNLKKIPEDLVLSKEFLLELNAPIIKDKSLILNEADVKFIERVTPRLHALFNANLTTSYISSCYRMAPLIGNYNSFVPQKNIMDKIKATTIKFNDTVGLHIRKSDHTTSLKYSTTDKFIAAMDKEITCNSDASFFLSTDDYSTKRQLTEAYGKRILYNEVSSFARNNAEAAKDAVVDLYCLANTTKVYGSHQSSFSQVAAQIGGIPEITVR